MQGTGKVGGEEVRGERNGRGSNTSKEIRWHEEGERRKRMRE